MFLQEQESGNLVEILSIESLSDPASSEIEGRFHAGQEMQNPETFPKSKLIFPSGESLPQCWLDPDYRSGVSVH